MADEELKQPQLLGNPPSLLILHVASDEEGPVTFQQSPP